jgi:hypothetical protein
MRARKLKQAQILPAADAGASDEEISCQVDSAVRRADPLAALLGRV